MNRHDIINHLISKNGYKTYLEIGVSDPARCYFQINIEHKDGVDPFPRSLSVNYPMTSDRFFLENNKNYDIIFIDGDHRYEQVKKDLNNSLKILADNGTIVMHDCLPPTKWHQRPEWGVEKKTWNGTAWKAFAEKRILDSSLNMCVVDTDWGVGVVTKGKQRCWDQNALAECLVYEYFEKNKKEMMNAISIEEFLETY